MMILDTFLCHPVQTINEQHL